MWWGQVGSRDTESSREQQSAVVTAIESAVGKHTKIAKEQRAAADSSSERGQQQ